MCQYPRGISHILAYIILTDNLLFTNNFSFKYCWTRRYNPIWNRIFLVLTSYRRTSLFRGKYSRLPKAFLKIPNLSFALIPSCALLSMQSPSTHSLKDQLTSCRILQCLCLIVANTSSTAFISDCIGETILCMEIEIANPGSFSSNITTVS